MKKYWNTEYYTQISVEELQQKALESTKSASNKGKTLSPIVVKSKSIIDSWWGQAWCDNLEHYADYESRIERGKRYVRSGAVIDLKITGSKILARVQGQRRSPYKVEIHISSLNEEHCQMIASKCSKNIKNLEALINGDFPDELKELFTGENGIFPTPREISFRCSCPDWAVMCKHVAAVLYGVGVRFDENPFMFFTLRGIDVTRMVDVALENKVEMMLENVQKPSKRILNHHEVENTFGIK